MTLTEDMYTEIKRDALRDITRDVIRLPDHLSDDFDTVDLRSLANGWVSREFTQRFAGFSTEEILDVVDVSDAEMREEAFSEGRHCHPFTSEFVRSTAKRSVEVDLHNSLRVLDEEMKMTITIHDTLESLTDPRGTANPYPSEFVNKVYEWARRHNVKCEDGGLPPYKVNSAGHLVVDREFKRRFNEAHIRRIEAIDVVDINSEWEENPVIGVVAAYLFEEWSEYVDECDLRFD